MVKKKEEKKEVKKKVTDVIPQTNQPGYTGLSFEEKKPSK